MRGPLRSTQDRAGKRAREGDGRRGAAEKGGNPVKTRENEEPKWQGKQWCCAVVDIAVIY